MKGPTTAVLRWNSPQLARLLGWLAGSTRQGTPREIHERLKHKANRKTSPKCKRSTKPTTAGLRTLSMALPGSCCFHSVLSLSSSTPLLSLRPPSSPSLFSSVLILSISTSSLSVHFSVSPLPPPFFSISICLLSHHLPISLPPLSPGWSQ